MLIARLLGVLVAITIASGIVAFLFTRDRRYLRFAWLTTRYALIFVFFLLCLLVLERLLELV